MLHGGNTLDKRDTLNSTLFLVTFVLVVVFLSVSSACHYRNLHWNTQTLYEVFKPPSDNPSVSNWINNHLDILQGSGEVRYIVFNKTSSPNPSPKNFLFFITDESLYNYEEVYVKDRMYWISTDNEDFYCSGRADLPNCKGRLSGAGCTCDEGAYDGTPVCTYNGLPDGYKLCSVDINYASGTFAAYTYIGGGCSNDNEYLEYSLNRAPTYTPYIEISSSSANPNEGTGKSKVAFDLDINPYNANVIPTFVNYTLKCNFWCSKYGPYEYNLTNGLTYINSKDVAIGQGAGNFITNNLYDSRFSFVNLNIDGYVKSCTLSVSGITVMGKKNTTSFSWDARKPDIPINFSAVPNVSSGGPTVVFDGKEYAVVKLNTTINWKAYVGDDQDGILAVNLTEYLNGEKVDTWPVYGEWGGSYDPCLYDRSVSGHHRLTSPGKYRLHFTVYDAYQRSKSFDYYYYIPAPTVKITYPRSGSNMTTCQGMVSWESKEEDYGNITKEVIRIVDLDNPNNVWEKEIDVSPTHDHKARDVFYLKPECVPDYRRYNLSVTAYDESGASGTDWIIVYKGSLPTAKVSISSHKLDEGHNITFDGSRSFDVDWKYSESVEEDKFSNIRKYLWVYQYPHSGSLVWRYAEGEKFSMLYPNITGIYTGYLFVIDDEGTVNFTKFKFEIGSTGITQILASNTEQINSNVLEMLPKLLAGTYCGCWPGGGICTGTSSGSCPDPCSPSNCEAGGGSGGGSSGGSSGGTSNTGDIQLGVLFPREHTYTNGNFFVVWSASDSFPTLISSQKMTEVYGTGSYSKTYSIPYEDFYEITNTLSYRDTGLASILSTTTYWNRNLPSYGPMNVSIRVSDEKGYSDEVQSTFYVDTAKPHLKVSPIPGPVYNLSQPEAHISWNATDVGYGVAYIYITSMTEGGSLIWRGVLPSTVNSTSVPIDPNYDVSVVTVEACDLSGNCNVTSVKFRYTTLPVAVANSVVCPPQYVSNGVYSNYYNVTLDGSNSYDVDDTGVGGGGGIVNYQWTYQIPDSEDCSIYTANRGGPVVHAYYPLNCTGDFKVTLSVTDDEGQVGTTTAWVIIEDPCPDCIDLYIPNVSGKSSLDVGENQTIYLQVSNIGGKDLSEGTDIDVYDNGNLLRSFFVDSLSTGDIKVFNYTWTPEKGHHEIKVVADPENKIEECNESNNVGYFGFYVEPQSVNVNIIFPPNDSCVPNNFSLDWEVITSGNVELSNLTIQIYNESDGGTRIKDIELPIQNIGQAIIQGSTIISLPQGIGNILVNVTANTVEGINDTAIAHYRYDGVPPSVFILYPKNRTNVTTPSVGVGLNASDVGCGIEDPLEIYAISERTGDLIFSTVVAPGTNHTVVKIDDDSQYWPKSNITVEAIDLAGNKASNYTVVRYTTPPTAIVTICDPLRRCSDFTSPQSHLIWGNSRRFFSGILSGLTRVLSYSPVLMSPLLSSPGNWGHPGGGSPHLPTLTWTLRADKSYDPDGTWGTPDHGGGVMTRYSWIYEMYNTSLHEKSNKTATGVSVSVDYSSQHPGLYGVWLNATDDEGQTAQATGTVAICRKEGCPDPAIMNTDIHLKWSELKDGDNESAMIVVHNIGNAGLPDGQDLTVKIVDSGKLVDLVQISPDDLPACSSYTINVTWVVDYIGHNDHTLVVTLDPNNAIGECDETNNEASAIFYVYPTTRAHLETNCSYDEKCAIAARDCPDYWQDLCSSEIGRLIPCCEGDPTGSECAKICNTTASVYGWLKNPEYQVSWGKIETFLAGEDEGYFTDLNPNDWTNRMSNKWEYNGVFSTYEPGLYTLNLTGGTVDGSTASSKVKILVSKTGGDFKWPDIAVENIEVIPSPLTGLPSNIYVTIKNKGFVPAKAVDIGGFIVPESSYDEYEEAFDSYIGPLRVNLRDRSSRERGSSGDNLKSFSNYVGSKLGSSGVKNLEVERVSLAAGEDKRLLLKLSDGDSWVPEHQGAYIVSIMALPVDTMDLDYTDNYMNKTVYVEVGREVSNANIPEYPGITVILALLIVSVGAYLISRRE